MRTACRIFRRHAAAPRRPTSSPGRPTWSSRPRTPISSRPWPCAWWNAPTCCCSRSPRLADDAFRTALEQAAVAHQRKVFLPHGAIIGIDGLVGRRADAQVGYGDHDQESRQPGLAARQLQGGLRGARPRSLCKVSPQCEAWHAAIALAGLGFDRTVSRIVADPAVSTNSHLVEVEGTGYRFRIEVSSEAGGKVTGAYTPQSALNTLRRICRGQGGLRFV